MHLLPIDVICQQFALGPILSSPKKISGGLLHTMWQIETAKGLYAVKELNSAVLRLLNKTIIDINKTEEIAAKMQVGRIPAVVALPCGENYYLEIDCNFFMVFPWIEGVHLNSPVSIAQAHQIGKLLADIHSLHLQVETLSKPQWIGYPNSYWQLLIEQREKPELNWFDEVFVALPGLLKWSEQAESAHTFLNQSLVTSHRDLNPKNVLWENGHALTLVDWEYAGLIHPQLELLIVAMNWSFMMNKGVNATDFKEVLEGYREQIVEPGQINEKIIFGYFGYVLEWVEFNLRRAIHLPKDRGLARKEIEYSLAVLNWVSDHQSEVLELLRSS